MLVGFLGVLVWVHGDPAGYKTSSVVTVTEGQVSKGTWCPFCHMLLVRKKEGKDRQMKKCPTKGLGLRHHPQRKKQPKTENKEIEDNVLWSLEVQRAQIPLIHRKGSLPCYTSGNTDTWNWRQRGSINLWRWSSCPKYMQYPSDFWLLQVTWAAFKKSWRTVKGRMEREWRCTWIWQSWNVQKPLNPGSDQWFFYTNLFKVYISENWLHYFWDDMGAVAACRNKYMMVKGIQCHLWASWIFPHIVGEQT